MLDVDGVVLDQPRLLNQVARKIVTYVKTAIPKGNLNMMEAAHVNEILYKSCGHTHRGLQKVYGPGVAPLSHFQDTIYDYKMIEHLWCYKNDPTMRERGQEVLKLLDAAAAKDVPVYLFSNSPLQWCKAVVEILELGISQDSILCYNHPVFRDALLKPDPKLYEHVATFIQQTHREKGVSEIMFVDDSWNNLVPVMGSGVWQPIMFSPDGPNISSPRVFTVRSLLDLPPYLV